MELVQKSAQSWFGRWLRLPQMVHAAFWLSALSAVIFLPVFHYVENSNERHRLDAELSLQQQEWDKQEKILQTLRQKSDSRQLSPELANSVLPINQHVQALFKWATSSVGFTLGFFSTYFVAFVIARLFCRFTAIFDRTFKRCSYTFFNSIKH